LTNAIATGFDIATVSGPLFEEPMMGAIFIIESIELVKELQSPEKQECGEEDTSEELEKKHDTYGPFNG
jgi:hypothetical protein